MSISVETKVGRLAAEHPLATRVFARHGIDYCCGGGRPLAEVCHTKGLDVEAVMEEIRQELETPGVSEERWDEAPLGDLIEHILAAYHRPLREELPRLESMAARVLQVHHDKDPERLPQLLAVFRGLKAELEDHMMKEEQILFPMIKQGQGMFAEGPISVMEHEHDSAASALRRLNELTDGYEVPAEACNTWRALWHGLAALEGSLHQHIHLENNILFPRALES
jgi:regulator of cell morphogenesis and NO signaling